MQGIVSKNEMDKVCENEDGAQASGGDTRMKLREGGVNVGNIFYFGF